MSSYLDMVHAITVKHSDKIKRETSHFCEYFHIAQLWHNRVDDRGYLQGISNHPSWTEYFASEKLYEKCHLLRHSKYVSEGMTILSDEEAKECVNQEIIDIFYDGTIQYNSNTWITLVHKNKSGTDQFGFFLNKNYLALFINEMRLVNLFTGKLRENLQPLYTKMEGYQANLVDIMGSYFYKNLEEETPSNELRQKLLGKLGLHEAFNLTSKEKQVIKLVLEGFSASAIAPQMFLAKRTIEHFLERIKEKLNCGSKTELIQKAREMEAAGILT